MARAYENITHKTPSSLPVFSVANSSYGQRDSPPMTYLYQQPINLLSKKSATGGLTGYNPTIVGIPPGTSNIVIVRANSFDEKTDRYRKGALGLAITAMLCGSWLCAIPALVLAILPGSSSKPSRPMYTASMVLGLIAIVTTIAIVIGVAAELCCQ